MFGFFVAHAGVHIHEMFEVFGWSAVDCAYSFIIGGIGSERGVPESDSYALVLLNYRTMCCLLLSEGFGNMPILRS